MTPPGTTQHLPVDQAKPDHCGLCGASCAFDPDAFEASGLNICPNCLEGMLHAPADDARSEVGLVGRGGGRA